VFNSLEAEWESGIIFAHLLLLRCSPPLYGWEGKFNISPRVLPMAGQGSKGIRKALETFSALKTYGQDLFPTPNQFIIYSNVYRIRATKACLSQAYLPRK
jgi:hypothetical protein